MQRSILMHDEGAQLQAAAEERASAVYKADEKAKSLLGRAEGYIAQEFFEAIWLNGEDLSKDLDEDEIIDLFEEIEWSPREPKQIEENSVIKADTIIEVNSFLTAKSNEGVQPLEETSEGYNSISGAAISFLNRIAAGLDSDLIVVELDEVVVRSQRPDTTWLLHYAAVVIAAGRTYYLSAARSTQLLYQVGSLLAALGVHTTEKRLLLMSDTAGWIRYWFDGLAVKSKESVLCWYHLKKRCWRLIREGIKDKEDRLRVRKELLSRLWRGEVEEARKYLSEIILDCEAGLSRMEIIDLKAIERLKEYLLLRQLHITNYLARVRAKEWIANTKAEKFNDWSVSVRCKKQNGMRWTSGGVGAIAALEAAQRNGELEEWRKSGRLPSWESREGGLRAFRS